MSTVYDLQRARAAGFRKVTDRSDQADSGFDLWDYLQMVCTSGRRGAYRLTAAEGGPQGMLFFERGALVDARCGELAGDEAAVLLLSHREAECEHVKGFWTREQTVCTSLSGLLLRAVGEIERAAERRPRRDRISRVQPVPEATQEEAMGEPSAKRGGLSQADFRQLAWLDVHGGVRQSLGDDPAFPDRAAHAVRVAELLGQLLSLGEFLALDCRGKQCERLVYRDGEGGVVACEPTSAEVAAQLRGRLGMS